MHQQLLGHLFDALDDEEQAALDVRLERDGACRRELAAWRRRLAALAAMRPDFEPPPGLAERTCRFVAAHASAFVGPPRRGAWRRMSPRPAPHSYVGRVRWLDMAVVISLLATTVALILPAIDSSRFRARLAACQNDLRQFGAALTDCDYQHGGTPSELADNGKLTDMGVLAAELLRDEYLADGRRAVCPDAWLAAQGVPRGAPYVGQIRNLHQFDAVLSETVLHSPPGLQSRGFGGWSNNWPGTWRDGTTSGLRLPPSPADVPLLADAPSADVPDQPLDSHGGLGRNLLFADGHVNFLSCATSRDTADPFFAPGHAISAANVSAPIVFVSSH
jgi:prepilin-type processing-associated H-X9-DG protein